MKKNELLDKIKKDLELSSRQIANDTLEGITDIILDVVKEEGKLKIPGFGTFTLKKTKAKIGRNPRTGEAVEIAEKKSIKFKSEKTIDEWLNE